MATAMVVTATAAAMTVTVITTGTRLLSRKGRPDHVENHSEESKNVQETGCMSKTMSCVVLPGRAGQRPIAPLMIVLTITVMAVIIIIRMLPVIMGSMLTVNSARR